MTAIEDDRRTPVKQNPHPRPFAGGVVSRQTAREQWLGGVSESTEVRLARDPSFPQRVEISPGLTGYLVSELDEYLAKKVAQRDAGHRPACVLSGERLGRSGKGGRPRKAGAGAQLEIQLLPSDAE